MTDMQQKMKQEEERLAKLDPWKVMNVLVSQLVISVLTLPLSGVCPLPMILKKYYCLVLFICYYYHYYNNYNNKGGSLIIIISEPPPPSYPQL